jgi:hypothetical protein
MTENNDPITHQEKAFAHLLLSGTMTDRRAAKAVGLNPNNADHTKSKPRVRDYMLEHHAEVQQQNVEQDTEELCPFSVGRDQVLTRLWEIANMGPETTRNSMTAQVKAIAMIVAIEGLIPDRRAAQKQPAPTPDHANFYRAAWNRAQQEVNSVDPQTDPPQAPAEEEGTAPEPQAAAEPAEASFIPGPPEVPQTTSLVSRVPTADHIAPDTRASFSIGNRFGRRR